MEFNVVGHSVIKNAELVMKQWIDQCIFGRVMKWAGLDQYWIIKKRNYVKLILKILPSGGQQDQVP